MTKEMIGHNNPPSPFDELASEYDAYHMEAKNWLDGAKIENEKQAEAVAELRSRALAIKKKADALHKEEKAPHLEAGRMVDDKYRDIREGCPKISEGCRRALAPWLQKIEDEKRREAEDARKKADAEREAAEAKLREAREAADLEGREAAEQALKEAKKMEGEAKRAEKDTAKASSKTGRATGLKDRYWPEVENKVDAVKHYWSQYPDEFVRLALTMAEQDVRAGKREIPGFTIKHERVAV